MLHLHDLALIDTLSPRSILRRGDMASIEWIEKLVEFQKSHVKDQDAKERFILDLEHDSIGVLSRMETRGITVDIPRLRELGSEMDARILVIEDEVFQAIGERINLGSPKQLQALLFDRLKLTASKKTKTGYSVDEEVLQDLAKTTPMVALILEHRTLKKLKGTYIEGILKEADTKTQRVYTTYRSIGAATGRMSSEKPNLQNIPASDSGYPAEIKRCFIPSSADHVLVVADYSQVELRILATLSGDPNLISAFQHGEDIHTRTARLVFGVENITSDMRRVAKSVNFGVIYGVTGFGLSRMLDVGPAEGKRYIDAFFQAYPTVRAYYDTLLAKARETGYVETFYGRRRYLPALNDSNKMIRSMAEREAINAPIQGTAADVIKIAMVALDQKILSGDIRADMLLQIHDELVFECHRDDREAVEKTIATSMESVFEGPVRLTVGIHSGNNWFDAKR